MPFGSLNKSIGEAMVDTLERDDAFAEKVYLSQPDGGCSSCGVDNAGTTWSCIDVTCP